MQTNDAGEVAIRYSKCQRVLVQKTPSGSDYVFVVQANISMAWIKPDDVGNVLARKKRKCCGGSANYFYASEADVRQWTNKGGR